MKKLFLLSLLFLVGCGDRSNIGNEEIQSPLSRHTAEIYSRIISIEADGVLGSATGTTLSMGQGISHNSWLIFVDDWDNTQVGDVVIADHDGKNLIHQVISRTNDAMRTAGTNNTGTDMASVYRDDYLGTMIGQIYYRKKLDK